MDERKTSAQLSRRQAVASAGAVGALAAAVSVLPVTPQVAATPEQRAPSGDKRGYQASPHVLRYYETTRV